MVTQLMPRTNQALESLILVPSPRGGGLGRGEEWQVDSTILPLPALPAEGFESDPHAIGFQMTTNERLHPRPPRRKGTSGDWKFLSGDWRRGGGGCLEVGQLEIAGLFNNEPDAQARANRCRK